MVQTKMKSAVDVVTEAGGVLHIVPAFGDEDILVPPPNAPHALALQLLRTPTDPTTVARTVIAKHPAVVAGDLIGFIDDLRDAGLLVDIPASTTLSDSDLQRYDRQLAFFETVSTETRNSHDAQERIQCATVAIIGVGGVGALVGTLLAAAGIGTLALADGDTVSLSNLNRQILFNEADIGLPKVTTAAAKFCALNGSVSSRSLNQHLRGPDDVTRFIRGSNIVCLAGDEPVDKLPGWVSDACGELGIPFITMSNVPETVRVGPLFVPGLTSCWHCYQDHLTVKYPTLQDHLRQIAAVDSTAAATGWTCSVVAGLVVAEIISYLIGDSNHTSGTEVFVDTKQFRIETSDIAAQLCSHWR